MFHSECKLRLGIDRCVPNQPQLIFLPKSVLLLKPDYLAKGIWAKQPAKMLVLLWRIRWSYYTYSIGSGLGGCNGHISAYFVIRLTRLHHIDVLIVILPGGLAALLPGGFTERTGQGILEVLNIPIPRLGDLRIGDIIEGINLMTKNSPCWGLHWSALPACFCGIWLLEGTRCL